MNKFYKQFTATELKRKTIFTPNKDHKGRLIYWINRYFMGELSGRRSSKFCFRDELAYAIEQEHAIGYSVLVYSEVNVDWQMTKEGLADKLPLSKVSESSRAAGELNVNSLPDNIFGKQG